MKVFVKGYFHLQNAMDGRRVLEVDADIGTIRDLLDYLSERFGSALADLILDPETKDLLSHLMLLVNGRHIGSMPDRLDTKLKDGDEIALFPPIAGG